MTTLDSTTHDRTVVDLDLDDPRLGGGVAYEGPEGLVWGDEAFPAEDMTVRARTTTARTVDAAVAAARATAPGLQVRSRVVEADASPGCSWGRPVTG